MRRALPIALITVLPLLAHHSVQTEHDTTKIVTFKGTVTLVEFVNPHAHFCLDVVEPDGKVTNWAFEMAAPYALMRLGLPRDFFRQGDRVSVDAYAAKDGGKFASARTVPLPDGRTLDVHDSFGGQK
jgi:hypothetical protein